MLKPNQSRQKKFLKAAKKIEQCKKEKKRVNFADIKIIKSKNEKDIWQHIVHVFDLGKRNFQEMLKILIFSTENERVDMKKGQVNDGRRCNEEGTDGGRLNGS